MSESGAAEPEADAARRVATEARGRVHFEEEALELADQVFLFKRTIREAALRHQMYATFMAKPIASEPGSAMHIHHSVVDTTTGKNIFAEEGGNDLTRRFLWYIAGMQTYLPRVMCIMAALVAL